jgi:hypothetical protein
MSDVRKWLRGDWALAICRYLSIKDLDIALLQQVDVQALKGGYRCIHRRPSAYASVMR